MITFRILSLIVTLLYMQAASSQEKTQQSGTNRFLPVEKVLQQAVEDGAFPGCTAIVGSHDQILWQGAFGTLDETKSSAVKQDTIYDLASLTKVVGTTTVTMQLVARQKLSLDDTVAKWIPEFVTAEAKADDSPRTRVTIRHLLTHTSGLPSWKPFYKTADSYRSLLEEVTAEPLEVEPGTRYKYSDMGMILMGEILSRAESKPLAKLEQELVFIPLKMNDTLRNPPAALLPRIALTERSSETGDYIHGVVHDENSASGEGLTGHAGLFSTTGDLAKFAQEMLRALQGESRVLPTEQVRDFTKRQKLPGNARRGLGWQTFTSGYSGGTRLSETAFGHTGFTGTSIWIDPERDLFLILLTNRVHPTRENGKIGSVRVKFADAVVEATQ
ncbi:MAG TPA: serine hydrolase domain-containing protein [Planctomycetaceae bacterium]|nr:serine hydrolase domain-containing protein [Planctomycetaceae bacterium]